MPELVPSAVVLFMLVIYVTTVGAAFGGPATLRLMAGVWAFGSLTPFHSYGYGLGATSALVLLLLLGTIAVAYLRGLPIAADFTPTLHPSHGDLPHG